MRLFSLSICKRNLLTYITGEREAEEARAKEAKKQAKRDAEEAKKQAKRDAEKAKKAERTKKRETDKKGGSYQKLL